MTRLLFAAVAALALVAAPARAGVLTTAFNGTNGGANGWSVLYNLNVLAAAGVTVTSLEVNLEDPSIGSPFSLDVYTRSGTAVGFATNSGAGWTLVSSGNGTAAAEGSPSLVDVSDFFLAPGLTGVAIRYNSAAPAYSNGALVFGNADLSLTGYGATDNSSGPFSGSLFQPRTWNGTINYNLGAAAIPEPGTLAVFGLLAVGGMAMRRRKG